MQTCEEKGAWVIRLQAELEAAQANVRQLKNLLKDAVLTIKRLISGKVSAAEATEWIELNQLYGDPLRAAIDEAQETSKKD